MQRLLPIIRLRLPSVRVRGFSQEAPSVAQRKNFYGVTFDEVSTLVEKDLQLDPAFSTRLWSTVYQKGARFETLAQILFNFL